MKWSGLLVIVLLAAACSSSSSSVAEQAELAGSATQSEPDASLPPFALLPPADEQAAGAEEQAAAEDAAQPTTEAADEPVVETDPSIAWSAAESTRDVVNFLEALRAGAYEQAAWPAWGNGVLFAGQTDDLTGAEYLAQACDGGVCTGPYLVSGQPGVINPETAQASAVVIVTHLASGLRSEMPIVTFEGQRIIGNLPPLIADTNEASFRESLFGDSAPAYVVVERFEAFEIWDGENTTWFTNWHADATTQIEGDVLVAEYGTYSITNAEEPVEINCAQLLERAGDVLALDGCVTDRWALESVASGESVEAATEFPPVGEAESAWMVERGGTVLTGLRDAEGNLANLISPDGVDLLSGDYAGTTALSLDGTHIAYVDHGDEEALSHLWSAVVVVREIATGAEVGRWTLNGSAICLEFAVQWVVACEADDTTVNSGRPVQRSLVAIDIATGVTNIVPTATRVFLPVKPTP